MAMDVKNDLRAKAFPSQYNYFDRMESSEYGSIPMTVTKTLTASMDDKTTSYRYHPPANFQPATPPSGKSGSGDGNKANYSGTHSNWLNQLTHGQNPCGSTVIDCSQPQVRLSWRNHMEASEKDRANEVAPKINLPIPVHTRQRSMPVSMPSYAQQSKRATEMPVPNGLLSVDTESTSISRTSSTGNVKSNNVCGPNGSYNVVIDIQVRGPDPVCLGNRMTQSFIEDSGKQSKPSIRLTERQGSMDELTRNLLEDIQCFSLNSTRRYSTTDHAAQNCHHISGNRSNASSFSNRTNTCPDTTDESTTPSLDVSSEPIEFEDIVNQSKPEFSFCLSSHTETPIPNRRRTLHYSTEQAKASWSPQRAGRSSSVSMPRTDRSSTWSRSNVVNYSNNTIDVPQLIRLLQSPDPDVVANASAYLQHLVYRNPSLKDKTRQCGGIAALVQLLYSDHAQICLNTVGVLRNLTSGDNLEIKDELERVGGIRALAWLIENRQATMHSTSTAPTLEEDAEDDVNSDSSNNNTEGERTFLTLNEQAIEAFRPSLENAAAVLCNLAGVDHLKRSVLHEAILPSLVHTVIRNVANRTFTQTPIGPTNNVPYNNLLFRNTAAILRNVSSIDNMEYREQLRLCPHLLWSLITIVRDSVGHQCTDLKAVEHCICSIRNLSHSIHCSPPSDYKDISKSDVRNSEHKSGISLFRLRSSSLKRKQNYTIEEHLLTETYSFPPDSPLHLLYHNETIQLLLALLQQSSNPCTLEAAAGCLQNLTTGTWYPAQRVKETLRTIHGLPIITELLNSPSKRVTLTVANTLRNLATENQCCLLLGKHALPRIITALGSCTAAITSLQQPTTPDNSEWQLPNGNYRNSISMQSNVYGNFGEPTSKKLDFSVTGALLQLCAVLVNRRMDHSRRFTTMGGIEKCQEIYTSTKPTATTDNDPLQKIEEWVHHLAQQLLHIMWNFTELRPIYKLAGWNESDFGIAKRNNRLSSLVRRKSKNIQKAALNGDPRPPPLGRSDTLCTTEPTITQGSGWPQPRSRNNVPLYVRDLRTHKLNTARSDPINRVRSCHDPHYVHSLRLTNKPVMSEVPPVNDYPAWFNARWSGSLPPTAVQGPPNRSRMDAGRASLSNYNSRKMDNVASNQTSWNGNAQGLPNDPRSSNGTDIPDSWV